MDDDQTLQEKCENLMHVVVETRKRFGEMCTSYEQKSSLVENKLLNARIESYSNYKIKPKYKIPDIDLTESSKLGAEFKLDILSQERRIQTLLERLKDTQQIVEQLKSDKISKKARESFTVEKLMGRAKNK